MLEKPRAEGWRTRLRSLFVVQMTTPRIQIMIWEGWPEAVRNLPFRKINSTMEGF